MGSPDRHVRRLIRDLGFVVTLGHFWPSRGGISHAMLEVGRSRISLDQAVIIYFIYQVTTFEYGMLLSKVTTITVN